MNPEKNRHDPLRANYHVFTQALEGLLESNLGQYALVGEERIDIFPSAEDALLKGAGTYPPGEFIVQEIIPQTPVPSTFAAV